MAIVFVSVAPLGTADSSLSRYVAGVSLDVMLDADLAEVYNVTTKRLNEQVKRNADRFPEDFAFRLTAEEKTELVANCDRFDRLKHSTAFPLVFTEHGAIMAASILNSQRAVEASVYIVRAFVRMREALATHRGVSQRLNELEGRCTKGCFSWCGQSDTL